MRRSFGVGIAGLRRVRKYTRSGTVLHGVGVRNAVHSDVIWAHSAVSTLNTVPQLSNAPGCGAQLSMARAVLCLVMDPRDDLGQSDLRVERHQVWYQNIRDARAHVHR